VQPTRLHAGNPDDGTVALGGKNDPAELTPSLQHVLVGEWVLPRWEDVAEARETCLALDLPVRLRLVCPRAPYHLRVILTAVP
jgi:hypothetical protein